jgi:hypothetical protein
MKSILWGRNKSKLESIFQYKKEVATEGNNFQDIAIKKRKKINVPEFRNSREFILN